MSKLKSKPDIILDKVLAHCPNGKFLSDEQIDELMAICEVHPLFGPCARASQTNISANQSRIIVD